MKAAAMLVSVSLFVSSACDISLYDPDEFRDANAEDLVIGASWPDLMIADGASINRVSVVVSRSIPTSMRSVGLSSTHGTFRGGTNGTVSVSPDSTNTAIAELVSPTNPGSGRLAVTVAGHTRAFDIFFDTARATSLAIESSGVSVLAGYSNEVTYTALLRRSPGHPSPGQEVAFEVLGPSNVTIGYFRSIGRTQNDGTAKAVFVPGPVGDTVQATVRARTAGVEGMLTAETVLWILPSPVATK